MICYFSGTGNSQRAARQIAARCGDRVFSINHALRDGTAQTLHSDTPFVFVTPTYGWRMPRVVQRWIEQITLTGSKCAYFILTCGSDCGNAAAYAKVLCEKKGLTFCGLAGVVMPENYLAMFPTPNKAEGERILAASVPVLDKLADCVLAGRPLPGGKPNLVGHLKSGPVNGLFYAVTVSDKGFTVGTDCIGCGLCAKRCPLGNITLADKMPRWNGSCTHCMACISGCPTEAIEYKQKSKGRPRYFIWEDEG